MKAFRKEHAGGKVAMRYAGILFLFVFACTLLSAIFLSEKKDVITKIAVSPQVAPPAFSVPPGIYANDLRLTLDQPANTGIIFYTSDGSIPSPSSLVYNGPINISPKKSTSLVNIPSSPRWVRPVGDLPAATVIRCAFFTSGGIMSTVNTATYLIQPAENPVNLPIVSLVANKDDFFGYKKGIYVMGKAYEDKDNYARKNVKLNIPWWQYPANYQDRGKDSERPVHVEFMEPGNKNNFSIGAGIRIHGNATRGFAQKSLRLRFSEDFAGTLNHPVFQDDSIARYKTLILRNAGNDWSKTMMRDAVLHSITGKSTGLEVSSYRPVVVLINGEYWGIHQLCQRLDEDHLGNKYAISKDSIELVQIEGGLKSDGSTAVSSFRSLLEFAKTKDLADAGVFDSISRMMDTRNFIDYIITESYAANSDWPGNNVKCWRYATSSDAVKGVRDGRWRWIMHDLDYGMGYTGDDAYTMNLFEKLDKDPIIGLLLRRLCMNSGFRQELLSRARDLMSSGYSFAIVNAEISRQRAMLAPEMSRQVNRWRSIPSIEAWEKNITVIRTFAQYRPAFLLEQLETFLGRINKQVSNP